MYGVLIVSCILCPALIPILLAVVFFNWLIRFNFKYRERYLLKKRMKLEKKIQKIDKELLDIQVNLCYT